MTEKTYNEITVKDIADYADINRKTFYNYYRGVYQVIEEIENELIAKLDELIEDLDFKAYLENPSNILENMNAVINEDIEFYRHLFSLRDGYTLIQKVVEYFKCRIKEALMEQFPDTKEWVADTILDYSVTGTINVYHQWFNSDQSQSLEEISKVLSQMTINGISIIVSG